MTEIEDAPLALSPEFGALCRELWNTSTLVTSSKHAITLSKTSSKTSSSSSSSSSIKPNKTKMALQRAIQRLSLPSQPSSLQRLLPAAAPRSRSASHTQKRFESSTPATRPKPPSYQADAVDIHEKPASVGHRLSGLLPRSPSPGSSADEASTIDISIPPVRPPVRQGLLGCHVYIPGSVLVLGEIEIG